MFAFCAPQQANANQSESETGNRFRLEGIIGAATFAQGGSAPPICCGERDTWTAHGFDLGVRVQLPFSKAGRVTLGALYSLYTTDEQRWGGENGTGYLTVHITKGMLGVDIVTSESNDGTETHLGLIVGGGLILGYDMLWVDFGLSYGMDFQLDSMRLGFELDVTMGLLVGAQAGLRLVVGW